MKKLDLFSEKDRFIEIGDNQPREEAKNGIS
jgi:hypothetical protein